MKATLTHLTAFLVGVIALPILLLVITQFDPNLVRPVARAIIPLFIKVLTAQPTTESNASHNLKIAKTELDRFYSLGPAAKYEFNQENIVDAKKYATELAALTPKYAKNWNYGNAVQDSNLVLGRIAIRDGNLDAAKVFLAEEAKSQGSPQMDSFGPNVSLAKDLLEKGEREAVINYFTACKTFWKGHDGKLDDWIASAKAGNIPDFGANLIY